MVTEGYTATLVAATLAISPVESLLPEEASRQPTRPQLRRTDRGGVRTKTCVWLSAGDVVAAEERKSVGESQASAAGDARTRVDALASPAGSPPERVGPRGSL